jgi:hypothetical protein
MTVSILTQALHDGLAVGFSYDDKVRLVEVHAVGETLMRGYQVAGESSRPLPCWALFKTDKIENLSVSFVDSEAPRPGYKTGDKQIPVILAQLEIV